MSKKSLRGEARGTQWPQLPEPLPSPGVDTHTHIDLQELEPDTALEWAEAAGVQRIVQVGVDVPSSRWGVEFVENTRAAATHDVELYAAVALHPNEAPVLSEKGMLDESLTEIDRLASQACVRVVGETGLDHFRTGEEGRAPQRESLRAHIEIAKRHDVALMIHDREAHAEVLEVLDAEGAPDRVILHCFSGDRAFAEECARRGYFMSFAGNITFKNAQGLRDAVLASPPELLLTETDGPFLTPVPYRGRPNGPYLIPLTLRFLAELCGADVVKFSEQIWANSTLALGLR